MPASPNTDNYLVGKGIVLFKKKGSSVWRDMGNVSELEFTVEVEKLEHFSSRQGVRQKDKEIVIEASGTLRMLFDEFSPDNVAMALLGEVTDGADGYDFDISIFSQTEVAGELKYFATNDVGPRIDLHFGNVDFAPSQGFNPISEEWAEMELEGAVSETASVTNRARYRPAADREPENLIAPIIRDNATGLSLTGVAPVVGDVMVIDVGTWIDPGTFAYVWKAGGTPIGGATGPTYTVLEADIGDIFTCTVTPTNGVGAGDALTTPATLAAVAA